MATLENRSRFRVTVRNREDLTREFPFNAPARVASHMAELRAQGFKPAVTQLEDTILVRVRQKSRAPQTFTLPSVETAEKLIRKIEEERGRGLYVDYARSHKVTVAQLMVRYLKEKVPKLKSADMLTYKLEAMLMDSGPHGKALVEEFKDLVGKQLLEEPCRQRGRVATQPDAVGERCVGDLFDDGAGGEEFARDFVLTLHDDLNFFAGARTLCRALQVEVCGRGARGEVSSCWSFHNICCGIYSSPVVESTTLAEHKVAGWRREFQSLPSRASAASAIAMARVRCERLS